jgi:diguanylate cyclase (GGDEF)-like protein
MRRLLDVLLTTDPLQRVRLAQSCLAIGLMVAGVVTVHYFASSGVAPARGFALWIWTGVSALGIVAGYAVVRAGWTLRLADPALTVPMMVFAIACCLWAYALLGAGRGAVFPIIMVTLMFGMFVATPRQMAAVGALTVGLFAATAALLAWLRPAVHAPAIEFGHFLVVATMVPAVAVLAARLSGMRDRLQRRRQELTEALARIRELVIRDELTGLVNRRHMQELIEHEHQRCIRSGQCFCLAKLDIDRFGAVNDAHGYAAGDAVLRAVAQEAQRLVRSSDVLARWGGEEFMLMLPDTRAALARGGLERLQQRVAALRIVLGDQTVSVTLSAGLAEHHAGETIEQTIERAGIALAEAKSGVRGARVHSLAAARR